MAYKWILAPPKRDVRALCATQSVPGSTKKRQKKKPKVADENTQDIPSTSENLAASGIPPPSPNIPFVPIPTGTTSSPPHWFAKNPAFAQYHSQVWKTQNPGPSSSGALAAEILQRLQNPSPQPHVSAQPSHLPVLAPQRPEVVIPALQPRFNLPLPPPLLSYPPQNEAPIFPRPPIYVPPMENHRDLSAGILFVHSDLGQNQAWRDRFTAQFYRSPAAVTASQTRPSLPTLLPRPRVASPSQQPVVPGAQPYVQQRYESGYGSQGQA